MTRQSLGAAIDEAERILTDAGVNTPRDDAEILAAHVLNVDSADLNPQVPLDMNMADTLHRLVARRADRIPLGHIIGRVRLGGVQIAVGPGVFIPRAHTEPLLAWSLEAIRDVPSPVVVDLCTGSGAIALAIAHARPDATVHALDSDPVALEFARRNADQRSAVGDTTIRLYLGDVTNPTVLSELNGTVDLVVANPPYVPEGTALLPEWGEHHPKQSIYGGDDGFRVIRGVINLSGRLLRPGAGLGIEHHHLQVDAVAALFQAHGAFTDIATCSDYVGQTRHTTARKRDESN